MIYELERSVEWELAGETEVLGGNLRLCYIVRRKSYMIWPEYEPGSPG
jgi:hypothetical protein